MVKNLPANAGDAGDMGSLPGSGRSPWRRKWQPTAVFSPGKCHGQRSLAGCSPWGHKELGTTEHDVRSYLQNVTVVECSASNVLKTKTQDHFLVPGRALSTAHILFHLVFTVFQ